jgi:hypothetical protein
VEIRSPKRNFLGSTDFSLYSPNPGAVIHYTLDGSEPSAASPIYASPITLTTSSLVQARAFSPGMDERYVARASFSRLTPLPADSRAAGEVLEPGLLCRYYEGSWQKLPDFGPLHPQRQETVATVALPAFVRPEYYGLVLTGYVVAPADGLYTLHLWSDDGSALFIDGRQVADNDGMHGKAEKSADVALQKGPHAVEVRFLQGPGDSALELWWEGPGMELQPVEANALRHGGPR